MGGTKSGWREYDRTSSRSSLSKDDDFKSRNITIDRCIFYQSTDNIFSSVIFKSWALIKPGCEPHPSFRRVDVYEKRPATRIVVFLYFVVVVSFFFLFLFANFIFCSVWSKDLFIVSPYLWHSLIPFIYTYIFYFAVDPKKKKIGFLSLDPNHRETPQL